MAVEASAASEPSPTYREVQVEVISVQGLATPKFVGIPVLHEAEQFHLRVEATFGSARERTRTVAIPDGGCASFNESLRLPVNVSTGGFSLRESRH